MLTVLATGALVANAQSEANEVRPLGVAPSDKSGYNLQLDLGCNFGVTEAAPDYSPFVGFSARF